jgi:UDP:flavonoid glycosyltransferase YjiC (YdhE family)
VHLTLFTVGSRGDVEPYLALGLGLQAAGHTVRLATHTRYKPEITAAGFEFSPLAGDPRVLVEGEAGRRWMESGRNPLRTMRRLLDLTGGFFDQFLADCEAAMIRTDGVLFSVLAFPPCHLAEAARVPAVAAWLQPMSRTRAFPSLFFRRGGPGWFNRVSHVVTEQIIWLPVRSRVNRWRESLGLGPLPASGLYRPVYRTLPVLYGFSPLVVSPPPDWSPLVRVTGYWSRPQPDDWAPPARLLDFLAAGPPPVYVGFGSRPERRPEALAELVLASVRRADCRAVLLRGWGGLDAVDPGDDVLVVDEVPHTWLFPRMAGVVHHGGAGTTGTALQSGTPSVVVPSFADQFFWGERTAALGAGVNLPRRRLSVPALTASLQRVVGNGSMQKRAGTLGGRLRAEDGVGRAVRELGDILSR